MVSHARGLLFGNGGSHRGFSLVNRSRGKGEEQQVNEYDKGTRGRSTLTSDCKRGIAAAGESDAPLKRFLCSLAPTSNDVNDGHVNDERSTTERVRMPTYVLACLLACVRTCLRERTCLLACVSACVRTENESVQGSAWAAITTRAPPTRTWSVSYTARSPCRG